MMTTRKSTRVSKPPVFLGAAVVVSEAKTKSKPRSNKSTKKVSEEKEEIDDEPLKEEKKKRTKSESKAKATKKKAELPELLLPNAPAWRSWLEQNHATSAGVWLVIGKKGGSATTMTRQSALDEALCFGWIDGQAGRRDDHTYLQRYTRRGPRSNWSQVNVGHIARLEAEGRMRDAGREAVDAAKEDGRWDAAYAAASNTVAPQDLLDAIAANDEAQAMYDVLTNQNRFAMVYRLSQLKTQVARERNIAKFVDMLSRRETFHPQKRMPE